MGLMIKHQLLLDSGWRPLSDKPMVLSTLTQSLNGVEWFLRFRLLRRHRYFGVTPDNAIRYRQYLGVRLNFDCLCDNPEKLLMSSLSEKAWLRWLIDKILTGRRGYQRHDKKLHGLRIYHQNQDWVNQLLVDSTFLTAAQQLTETRGLLGWECALNAGRLQVNLTIHRNTVYSTNSFLLLTQRMESLAIQLLTIPHNIALPGELNHVMHQQPTVTTILKGFLIVFGFLGGLMLILMGLIYLLWL